ncbi:MAG: hypothetical protein ACYDA3_06675 [Gaiellaceae bacterium]
MRRTEGLLRRVDAWVFALEDARRLAAVRIGLCGLLASRLATTDYSAVAGQPAALFQPLTYMKLFARMPSQEVATTLQICGIVAALAAAAGLALRASLPLAFICSLVLNGMLNSTGRVIVGDAVLNLCLLLLVAAGAAAGEVWSIRFRRRARSARRGTRYGWPVRTAMITIALAYFFAGFQKWRYSGLPWVTSDNLRWVLYSSSDSHKYPNALALFIADRPLLAHLFAAGSLLLETCFPLVLFVPRLRWLFIPGAIAMHVGIRLATGLDYSTQWLAALIVFVNWPVVIEWLCGQIALRPVLRESPR